MKEKDTCDIYCNDEPKVSRLQEALNKQDITGMTRMVKILADETRMKIAYVMCQEEEVCVCDVANVIGSSLATASHHLRALKNLGFAKYRKEGKLVFYSLEDNRLREIMTMLSSQNKEMVFNG
jgi:DNA-binding transcriptional ArsR family regulator